MSRISRLPSFDEETGHVHIVVETPKGSQNKYKYDERRRVFKLNKVLPEGASFPFDFGFVPSTLAEDGDPIDVLLLLDEAAFPGCLIEGRLIGVIEAEQTEDGKTTRNDRLIAVSSVSRLRRSVQSLDDVDKDLIDEIEYFFKSYNRAVGRRFKSLGRRGPDQAKALVKKAERRFRHEREGRAKKGKKAKAG